MTQITADALAGALNAEPMRLAQAGRYAEAEAAYRTALASSPRSAPLWCNFGAMLKQLGRYDEAIEALRRSIEMAGGDPAVYHAWNNLGAAYLDCCDARASFEAYRHANRLAPTVWPVARNLMAGALYCDHLTAGHVGALHRRAGAEFRQRPHLMSVIKHERPRVGFVSSDFRHHVVSANLLPLAKRLAGEFDIYCFGHDITPAPDHVTAEYEREFRFRWIDGLTDGEAAELMRLEEIDVAVFCAGHLDRNRPTIACHRAAPVQVSMLDVATSGMPGMDYILLGRALDPPGSREWFIERRCYVDAPFVIEDLSEFPPVAPPRSGPPVFASFNNPVKMSPPCLAAWAEILARVPGSTLHLAYQDAYASPELRRRLLAALTARGVDEQRIGFHVNKASRDEHMGRYADVDVCLDTFPMSGAMTSLQAMIMGLPVVTLAGDMAARRWTAALLGAAGSGPAATATALEYVGRAVYHATQNLDFWRGSRSYIRDSVAASPLLDPARYARQVAALFKEMLKC